MKYLSVDVEADGPIPGANSMLSLGAVVFSEGGNELDSFSGNLLELPGAAPDPGTMNWWATKPEAWKIARENARSPGSVMAAFYDFLMRQGDKLAFVGYPASYDFMFAYWYLRYFGHESPFGFQAIDIKTLAMAATGLPWSKAVKANFPKDWFRGLPKHTHHAVDDAREQGMLFFRIREAMSAT